MEAVDRVNPWWYVREWEEEDPSLGEWSSQAVRWEPSWIDQISLEPFSLNFVYGPRQTGKTTGVKLLIRRLIRQGGVDPQAIFYLDLDAMVSLREFRKLMQRVILERRRRGVKKAYFFLDEVTSVGEWWRVLKFFIDAGDLRRDVLTLLGSSTVGLIKAPERFPGRTGHGRIVEVLPLSFPELVSVMGYSKGHLLYHAEELDEVWAKYKRGGGLPKSINSHPDAQQALISGLLSEVYKHGRSPRIVQELLASVISKIPAPFSYNSVAQEIGISHVTVREYLEFLSDLLLLASAPLKRNHELVHRKERKVFFRDPFILRTLSSWTGTEFLEGALMEGILQEHLYRRFGEVYYYKNHYEIDVISGGLKVELKAGKPHRAYPRGVKVLDEGEIPRFLLELQQEGERHL